MKVTLSGFNIEKDIIDAAAAASAPGTAVTPEVFAAAYARISRSPKGAEKLRAEARREIGKARRSNRTIIFEMGHHSVAEHAVFNFDIVGVSRLAVEAVEHFRLASYTEKSQRYQKLDGAVFVPHEISFLGLAGDFEALVARQNRAYQDLHRALIEAPPPAGQETPHERRARENVAREDARYATSLSTTTQLGATFNARSLELMLRRFASHPLTEVRRIGKRIHEQVEPVAPSIILFHEANDYDRLTYPALKDAADAVRFSPRSGASSASPGRSVRLVDFSPDADSKLASALLHTVTDRPHADCAEAVGRMDKKGVRELLKTAMARMELFDAAPREFEHAWLTYELVVSASCFAQLKRHRMATLTCQPYDAGLGVEVPPSIVEAGAERLFLDAVEPSAELHARVALSAPEAAAYCLTNSHRRRVLLTMNARELYHVARLRQDEAAQWEIREIAGLMVEQASAVMPAAAMLACGKDAYPDRYREVFGRHPKVVQAAPAGASDRRD